MGLLIFLFLIVVTEGYILLVFPLITLIVILIDVFMGFCRFVYHHATSKEAESRNELVLIDHWKDTSLNSILKKRKEDRQKYAEEFEVRTGRKPLEYEF